MGHQGQSLNTGRARWQPPRLTSKVFWDLAIWMAGFGLLVGVIFPFAVIVLGVQPTIALRAKFFAGALVAGVTVGLVNFTITRVVVGARLHQLSARMQYVGATLQQATFSGDWSKCSPEACQLLVDSNDELGDAAGSFNRLLESLAASREIELAIKSVGDSLTGHLAFDELVSTVLDQYMTHAMAGAGAVVVERDGKLSVDAQRNFIGDLLADQRALQQALRKRSITSVEIPGDLTVDGVVISFRPREVLVVPAWFGGQPLGGVILAFSENIHPNTSRLLEAFQASTAVALNNALTHERFQRLATLDPLTEAYNRRFGLNRLNEEFSRSTRTGVPLGVLSLDLDHFKRINDTYGHLAGDKVLRSVARDMFSSMRSGDILVRTGGEEFLLLLPGAGHNDVATLGERIRRATEMNKIDVGVAEVTVTISLGALSYYGVGAQDPEELLSKADQAMYVSKESGRNRLTVTRLQTPIHS